MQIDIVSDTVCPWCFIGKRRIERAMALRPDVKFDVVWRPYRLDPSIPREGVDRRAYLKAKFGDSPRTSAMGEAIRSEGESEGIAFAFDKIARSPNTLDSHRLIRWSANAGKQDQIVNASSRPISSRDRTSAILPFCPRSLPRPAWTVHWLRGCWQAMRISYP
jgi:predicted DsbA family dithiol-disulfide isomerase